MRRRPVRGSFSMASGIHRHMALRLVRAIRAAPETDLALRCRYRLAASNVRTFSLAWLAVRCRWGFNRFELAAFELGMLLLCLCALRDFLERLGAILGLASLRVLRILKLGHYCTRC